jgi:hypothetical protein
MSRSDCLVVCVVQYAQPFVLRLCGLGESLVGQLCTPCRAGTFMHESWHKHPECFSVRSSASSPQSGVERLKLDLSIAVRCETVPARIGVGVWVHGMLPLVKPPSTAITAS